MATKPTLWPEPWGTAGNYPASVYPAEYPWGDPHPNAGAPTTWSNQARRTVAGLAGYCAQGRTPLQPAAADLENEQDFRIANALTTWVQFGSSAGAADAHILETDATGKFLARGITITGVLEADADLGTARTLANFVISAGADLSAGQEIAGAIDSTIKTGIFEGVAGATLADPCTWGCDSDGRLKYREASEQFVHYDRRGFWYGDGEIEATQGPSDPLSVTTSTQVAAPTALDSIRIEGKARVRGAVPVVGSLEIQESATGAPASWNTIKTVPTFFVDNAQPGEWTKAEIWTVYTPGDTTARFFRMEVSGLGTNVTTEEARVVASSHWA